MRRMYSVWSTAITHSDRWKYACGSHSGREFSSHTRMSRLGIGGCALLRVAIRTGPNSDAQIFNTSYVMNTDQSEWTPAILEPGPGSPCCTNCSCFSCWPVGCLKGLLGGGQGCRRTFRVVGAEAIYQRLQKYFIILITTVAIFMCKGCISVGYRWHKKRSLREARGTQFSPTVQTSLFFQKICLKCSEVSAERFCSF